MADDDLLRLRPRDLAAELQRSHVVVVDAPPGVDVHAVVPGRVPREAHARPEVFRVPADAGIDERHRQRRLRSLRTQQLPGERQVVVEIVAVRAKLSIVAKPQVERQASGGLPVILHVEPVVLARKIGVRRERLGVLRRPCSGIGRVVHLVERERPDAERAAQAVFLERHVAEVGAGL